MSNSRYDVLLVGGGINGLAAAYHLSKVPALKVAIIEQFDLGHAWGSSHGHSRITRSVYPSPAYVKLMEVLHKQEWPRLEMAAGRKLIIPNPGCFFGKGNTFQEYIKAVIQAGADVEVHDAREARKIFPQFRFDESSSVIHDRTGGVIAAQDTIQSLITLIRNADVDIHEDTRALGIDNSSDPITVATNKGNFITDKLVVTAGPWFGEIVPSLQAVLTVARQTVCYVKLKGPDGRYRIGEFPQWCYIGDGPNDFFYGLPEYGREGIKIAQHFTKNTSDDPDPRLSGADPARIESLLNFIEQRFRDPVEKIVGSETCLYTNTPTEDFIIDLLPGDDRIALGSACSGHGFKFAPLTGRVLAELVLKGRTTVPEFEGMRPAFKASRYIL